MNRTNVLKGYKSIHTCGSGKGDIVVSALAGLMPLILPVSVESSNLLSLATDIQVRAIPYKPIGGVNYISVQVPIFVYRTISDSFSIFDFRISFDHYRSGKDTDKGYEDNIPDPYSQIAELLDAPCVKEIIEAEVQKGLKARKAAIYRALNNVAFERMRMGTLKPLRAA